MTDGWPRSGHDACRAEHRLGQVPDESVAQIEEACRAAEPTRIRVVLDQVTWQTFNATLAAAPKSALLRMIRQTESYGSELNCESTRMLEAIRQHAKGVLRSGLEVVHLPSGHTSTIGQIDTVESPVPESQHSKSVVQISPFA